jgi:hypothetical protein
VQLHHFAVTIEERRYPLDLAREALGVPRTPGRIARDDAIAATVKAGTEAERNMEVERERSLERRRITQARALDEIRENEVRSELGRARVGRITRTRAVIALDQRGIKISVGRASRIRYDGG